MTEKKAELLSNYKMAEQYLKLTPQEKQEKLEHYFVSMRDAIKDMFESLRNSGQSRSAINIDLGAFYASYFSEGIVEQLLDVNIFGYKKAEDYIGALIERYKEYIGDVINYDLNIGTVSDLKKILSPVWRFYIDPEDGDRGLIYGPFCKALEEFLKKLPKSLARMIERVNVYRYDYLDDYIRAIKSQERKYLSGVNGTRIFMKLYFGEKVEERQISNYCLNFKKLFVPKNVGR